MRVPLHNTKDREKIIDLHMRAAMINPKGFRQPSNKKQRRPAKKTRIERMAAEVYGK
tara:strand:+ start:546 stop:716 length:171 start_codon:yes stop_codon:yes gene_type:complete